MNGLDAELTESVSLDVIPDWTPALRSDLARFDLVVKIAAGHVLTDATVVRVRLLDAAGTEIAATSLAVEPRSGPAWLHVRGPLVVVDASVSQAEAGLAGVVSPPVFRRDARQVVMLGPLHGRVGADGEPHFWWRYYNSTSSPLSVERLRAQTVLWLDGRPLPLRGPYNGFANLPPGRALTGLWSVDDFDALHPGTHHARLQVGTEESGELSFEVGR